MHARMTCDVHQSCVQGTVLHVLLVSASLAALIGSLGLEVPWRIGHDPLHFPHFGGPRILAKITADGVFVEELEHNPVPWLSWLPAIL